MSQTQTTPDPMQWLCAVCQCQTFKIAVRPDCKVLIKCERCGFINRPTWQNGTITHPNG